MTRKQGLLSAILLIAIGLIGFTAGVSAGQERNDRVYEPRTYTALPGRLPALHARFAEHTLKLFEKHHIKNEAYWVPTDDTRKDNTLIYKVSHESREAANENWKNSQLTRSGSRYATPVDPPGRSWQNVLSACL
jgi:hypothetical protein